MTDAEIEILMHAIDKDILVFWSSDAGVYKRVTRIADLKSEPLPVAVLEGIGSGYCALDCACADEYYLVINGNLRRLDGLP